MTAAIQHVKPLLTLGLASVLVFSLTGCFDTSTPVEVNIDQDTNPLNPDGSSIYYPQFLTYVHVQAVQDNVRVTHLKVNRGNCPLVHVFQHPDVLKYGQEIKAQVRCDPDSIKEVEVTTDQDTYTFNF